MAENNKFLDLGEERQNIINILFISMIMSILQSLRTSSQHLLAFKKKEV